MSGPPGRRKYDTFNPAALPTANVGRGRIALDNDGKDALEAQYEAWNKRLDEEVGSMAKGLQELVELSNVSPLKVAAPHHAGLLRASAPASRAPLPGQFRLRFRESDCSTAISSSVDV